MIFNELAGNCSFVVVIMMCYVSAGMFRLSRKIGISTLVLPVASHIRKPCQCVKLSSSCLQHCYMVDGAHVSQLQTHQSKPP